MDADPPAVLPSARPSFVLTKLNDGEWTMGRAEMLYRDLIPDRMGGRFIASHIRIPGGGPVPDYVHYHEIQFQMIYCHTGWVRVVYEDQGAPFVMRAGDCVLQAPKIRHRVLECSPGMEVIEIACPAEHVTRADPDLSLPTPALRTDRDFGGQRFVRHEVARATWKPWRLEGFEARDLGIAAGTRGLAGAHVARRSGTPASELSSHDAEFLFEFVLSGHATLRADGGSAQLLLTGDALVVPAGLRHGLTECSDDLELLEVALPARFESSRG